MRIEKKRRNRGWDHVCELILLYFPVIIVQRQPPPQALRFSHGRGERETRVTGDEPQGTMGRVQTAGLLPAFLCAHIEERRLGTRQVQRH